VNADPGEIADPRRAPATTPAPYRSPIARRRTRSRRARRPVPHRPGGARLIPSARSRRQREAIAHSGGRLRIPAYAGSDKTEVLAQRAVRLLREGADLASIIAFTFTEKAAAELKARIESRAAEGDQRFRELPPRGR